MARVHCILHQPAGHVETLMKGSQYLDQFSRQVVRLSSSLGVVGVMGVALSLAPEAAAQSSGFRVSDQSFSAASDQRAAPAEDGSAPAAAAAPQADAGATQPAPDTSPAPGAGAGTPSDATAPPADGGPGEVRDMTAADQAQPLPEPAPEPETEAPEATSEEGPTPEEYSSSKDAGTALSGGEVVDRTTETTQVGKVKKEKKPKKLSHEKTGILGVGMIAGVSLITAGDKFCGEFSDSRQDPDSRKPICVGRTPFALDVLAGFGANARIDVIVNVRVNLETRDFDNGDCAAGEDICAEGKGLFNTKLGIGVAPGVRIYGKETDKIVKFGGVAQILYVNENFQGYRDRGTGPMEDDNDTTNQENEDGVGDNFLGLRGGPILQIDPHHNFGITLQPAMIPGFRPKKKSEVDGGWFEIGFEVALGFEARFP
jgi:hypothetical protein